MPNYNQLIYTAADFKVFIKFNGGGNYQLQTIESVSQDITVEDELIYAVSYEDAIGNKQNARAVKGKISLQLGEMNAILLIEGLQDATRIVGATIAITAIQGGFQRTYKNANINSEVFDSKRKDKETIVSSNFTALTNV